MDHVPDRRVASGAVFAAVLLGLFAASSARAALAVPAYSSLPGAHAKIYLDFGGTEYSGTWGGKTPGTIPAYDTDGNASSFTSTELANIRQIFVRVAEKYSPFNINVTTVDPGNLNNRETARLIIGGNGSWYGSAVGGVAFLNGFTNSSSNDGWVFPKNLSGGNPKTVAEATAHEAGHLFGLSHQSTWELVDGVWTETQEYSTNGNSTLKRPVMGSSYGSTRGLWWRGTTSSPTTIQDDLALLARTTNGFGYRADDHAGTVLDATPLIADSAGRVAGSGIIGTISDLDLFSFVTGTGTIGFTTALAEFGGMLDSSLQLFAGDGALLHTVASGSLTESLTWTVDAGQYFIGVSSRGNYGDIGQYRLTGQVVPLPVPEPHAIAMILALLYPLIASRHPRQRR
ncbi:MAG TPA: zinc-dependent metalloprotease family protein [Tepidisphaeraceae bacterium]|nr:zinc-dependent metalloprotease family protein [Tepidisphaeraceae bacterium]